MHSNSKSESYAALVLGAGDMPLHELDRLVAGGNVYACGGVAFRLGIRMHFYFSFQRFVFEDGLFLAVPAIRAKLTRLYTYRSDYTVERLEFERREIEFITYRFSQILSSFGVGIAVFLYVIESLLALKLDDHTTRNKIHIACIS